VKIQTIPRRGIKNIDMLAIFCEIMKHTFRGLFFKDTLIVADVIRILKSPASGSLLRGMNVCIGTEENKIRQLLEGRILREHKQPINEIDTVSGFVNRRSIVF